ncbi:MAG TPA: POTRA domain-containing protein, partial [Candidatus Krumholzibacteria bacterium]|nr:POTRA domain-containing protein [Candidatus Krumholzibacteria bacterium]
MLAALIAASTCRAASVESRVEGVDNEEILDNIEATLSIARQEDRDDLDAARIGQLHDRAIMEIRRAVEPFGYYHARVDTAMFRDGDDFVARYRVELGPPVRVRNVDVSVTGEGKSSAPFPSLAGEFPLRKGDVLDQRLYESRKATFAAAAADSGYLDASFPVSTIRVDREQNIADIALQFDTGPRYRFGPVTFDSSAVDERVLRAYLTFKPGDPFRYDQLLAFQSALGGTPYFSRVEAVALREQAANREIPIHVRLSSQRPRRYEIGVGYGTDTGPRVLLDAQFRRLNRAGHRYRGRANISQLELSLRAEYLIPSLYPDTHTWTISGVVARLDPDAYTTNRAAIGPTRSQPRFGWLESIMLSYEWEDFTVGSDEGKTNLLIGGLAYRLKKSDDDITPSKGYRL